MKLGLTGPNISAIQLLLVVSRANRGNQEVSSNLSCERRIDGQGFPTRHADRRSCGVSSRQVAGDSTFKIDDEFTIAE